MKDILKEIGLAVILGFIIPGVILHGLVALGRLKEETKEQTEIVFFTQPTGEDRVISVLNREQEVVTLDLEEYITGVVLAEMPASFEPEALKAQSVVARTYACRSERSGGKHDEASVCMDSSCCQSFIWPEDYLAKGGRSEAISKVSEAVNGTRGLVLTYEGELIEATYFSCSGGSTEDAVAVWGTEVPYLVATDSPGEEKATHYEDVVSLPVHEFMQLLELDSDQGDNLFGVITYTAGGGIDRAEIGGMTYTGTELRSMLGLKSTAITFHAVGEEIQILTRGYGHRVGMSQYGADAMALSGSSYQQILAHYYRGTSLEKLPD